MLCKVVCTVDAPKGIILMHNAVVPVEPEVEYYAIEGNLEREIKPIHLQGSFGDVVRHESSEDHSKDDGAHKRDKDISNANVWNTVTLVFITIKVAVYVAASSQYPELVNADEMKDEGVVYCSCNRAQVFAEICRISLVEDEWYGCMEDDPAMHHPARKVRDLVSLCVDWCLAVNIVWIEVENLIEPMKQCPIGATGGAPGRCHGVSRVSGPGRSGRGRSDRRGCSRSHDYREVLYHKYRGERMLLILPMRCGGDGDNGRGKKVVIS